ncbi:MAG: (2Fe-2S)-binding protein, partial [Actinomycetota bacterium]
MTPGRLRFEGREIPVLEDDTVASALFRAGLRTFSRSLKSHRRRGVYCGTGDCPNCMVTVDGVPGVRSCITPAASGMRVERGRGWPSADHDVLHVTDLMHPLMPVGFYMKTFIRPRFAWPMAERLIRRSTGAGRLPVDPPVTRTVSRRVR